MSALPKVKQYMDTEVHTLSPETPILDAVDFLLRHRVTGAPVIDAKGRLVGMLSERDCLKLLAEGLETDRQSGTVSDFMISEVVSIPPDMDIYWVAGIFLGSTVRRLPVVQDGKLVGAITRFDILRVIKSLIPRG
jgi:CBS domain-containing protein